MEHMEIPTLACKRCQHTWHPRRAEKPLRCPGCGTPYWDRPRRDDRAVDADDPEVQDRGEP